MNVNDQGATGRATPIDWMKAILWLLGRLTLILVAVFGGWYVLGRLKIVIFYVLVAVILAYIMRPMATWICRRNVLVPRRWPMVKKRGLATLYVLVFFLVGGYFSVRFMLNPFVNQIRDVSAQWETKYEPQFEKTMADTRGWYEKTFSADMRKSVETSVAKAWGEGSFQKGITGWLAGFAKNVGQLGHHIVEIVLLPVLAFYFALDSKKLKHELTGALAGRKRREVTRMIHEFNQIMHSFVVGQFILCALAGVVVGLGLWALNVPYALTLGLVAGFTRAIPIVGPILGGIPIIGIALVTQGMGVAIAVLIFFTILHFAESKFIMPMLIGERMELHPVVVILVLLVGQEFGGLLGMFFAAPVAAIIRVIIRRYMLSLKRTSHVVVPPTARTFPAPAE
jgi:predicted PurR-regulated permease PerM